MPFGMTIPSLSGRKRAQDRGECQKVALKMGAIQNKSFLPNEIGVDEPARSANKCHLVPFFREVFSVHAAGPIHL
jgi:hypothetical protein